MGMKGFLLKIKNEIKGIYSSIDDIIEFMNEVVCLVDKPFNLSDIEIVIYKLNTPIIQKKLIFCQNGIFEKENEKIGSQYFIKSSIFKNYKNILEKLNLKSLKKEEKKNETIISHNKKEIVEKKVSKIDEI